jgi:hypothetical protein
MMDGSDSYISAPDRKLRHWSELCRTDPTHTKRFERAGGFKGTAIRPIWNQYRLTEHFGPCGIGWGFTKPEYQIVQGTDELLVYCTIMCWYMDDNGERAEIYGVGGDKVTAKQQRGPFNDDEAFKKALTDAIGNAFLRVGLSADVHMGLFEDSKYVQETRKHFAQADEPDRQIEPPRPSGNKLEQFEQRHTPLPAELTPPIKFEAGTVNMMTTGGLTAGERPGIYDVETGEVEPSEADYTQDAAWLAAGDAVCEQGEDALKAWWRSLDLPVRNRMGGHTGALLASWKTRAKAADLRGGPAPETTLDREL